MFYSAGRLHMHQLNSIGKFPFLTVLYTVHFLIMNHTKLCFYCDITNEAEAMLEVKRLFEEIIMFPQYSSLKQYIQQSTANAEIMFSVLHLLAKCGVKNIWKNCCKHLCKYRSGSINTQRKIRPSMTDRMQNKIRI